MSSKVWISFLLAALLFWVCYPLILSVAMGGVLAALCVPLQRKLEAWKWNRWLSASLITSFLTLIIIVPLVFVLLVGINAGVEQITILTHSEDVSNGTFISKIVNESWVRRFLEWIVTAFHVDIQEILKMLQNLGTTAGLKLGELLSVFISQLPKVFLGLAVSLVSFFFFLVDGKKMIFFLRHASNFSTIQTESLLQSLENICRSVLLASIASGTAQAFIMFLGCLIFGVQNAALVSIIIFLTSFIPVIGSAPVSFGLSVYLWFSVGATQGIIFLIVALLISTVDNFVRPLFLKGSSNLHPLLAFVSAFGGLQVLGFTGVFLGPIIAGMFLAVFQVIVEERTVR